MSSSFSGAELRSRKERSSLLLWFLFLAFSHIQQTALSSPSCRERLRLWGVRVKPGWTAEELQSRWDASDRHPRVCKEDMKGGKISWKKATVAGDPPEKQVLAQKTPVGPRQDRVPVVFNTGPQVYFFKSGRVTWQGKKRR